MNAPWSIPTKGERNKTSGIIGFRECGFRFEFKREINEYASTLLCK
jgi:hypothetical protein